MFQNISDEVEEEEIENQPENKTDKWKTILKNMIKPQNLFLYVIAFFASMISITDGIAPFGLAIFAAACSSGVIAFPIFIVTLAGTLVSFGGSATLNYLLSTFIFLGLMLLIRPPFQEESRNEKRKLGMHLMAAFFMVQALQIFSASFMVSDVLETVLQCLMLYIFYKIFVNSIPVLKELGTSKVFTAEEAIGASLLVAIAICAMGDFSLWGFSVRNILSVLLVMMLAWQNGALVGTTTGVTLSVVLNLMGFGEPNLIAVYALAGMIAGALSRTGKIGIILGMVVGLAAVTFLKDCPYIQYIKEVLIAGVGLFIMPKKIAINIEDLVGKTKLLPVTKENRLEANKETIYKLNTMSQTIGEIAKSYEEAAATVVEEDEQIECQEKNREIFKEDLKINLENIQDNILYEDLVDMENGIVDDIFEVLLQKEEIESKDLLEIFENHNSFIFGVEDKEMEKRIERQIYQAVKNINYTYQVSKINFIWKKKNSESNKLMSEQLNTVSKVINKMAKGIENTKPTRENKKEEELAILFEQKDIKLQEVEVQRQESGKYKIKLKIEEEIDTKIETIEKLLSKVIGEKVIWKAKEAKTDIYESADKYSLSIGTSRTTKNKSDVSGDSSTQIKLQDGKYLLAISDGMGSGTKARKSSKMAISMLENLLVSGFDKESSIELINTALNTKIEEDMYATLDLTILDLYKANAEFVKTGACPTYVKTKDGVKLIKEASMPAGMISKIELASFDRDIEDGDIIVMCSDGILETAGPSKENWLKEVLEEIKTDNVQKIADIIIREAIDNGLGFAKDDMTIIVAKVEKNK